MSVYQRIREIAQAKKISIRSIESALNLAHGTLRKWQKTAPADKLERVANYLGTTVNYLISGSDTIKPKGKRLVDLEDDDVIMTFDGKPIPKDDLELIKQILRRGH